MKKLMNGRNVRLLCLCGMTAAVSLAGSGCGDQQVKTQRDAQARIEQAAREAQRVSMTESYPTPMGAGEAPTNYRPLTDRINDLEKYIKSLESIEGTATQRAAQAGMKADAGMSLSRFEIEKADRGLMDLMVDVRRTDKIIDVIVQHDALVQSMSAYNISDALKQLDSLDQQAQSARQTHQAQAQELTDQIASLTKARDAERDAGNHLQDQAATQREAAKKAPLDQQIDLIRQASQVGRDGDAHMVRSAELDAQIDQLKPQLAQVDTLIEQSELEIRNVASTRTALQARKQATEHQVGVLQTELKEAIENFSTRFEATSKQFNDVILPQYTKALTSAENALKAAQAAGRTGPGALRIVSAQQTVGQANWRTAMSLDTFAAFISHVVKNADALNRGPQDAVLLKTLQDKATAARTAAQSAFQAALESLKNSPGDKGGTLAAAIQTSLDVVSGKATVAIEDFSKTTSSEPAGEASASTVPASSPAELVQKYKDLLANSNLEGIIQLLYAPKPEQQQMLNSTKPLLQALDRLDKACKNQFKTGIFQAVANQTNQSGNAAPQMTGPFMDDMGGLEKLNPTKLDYRYDKSGTTAWVEDVPALANFNFRFVNGQWYLEDKTMGTEGTAVMEAMSAMLQPMADAVNSVADKTEKGEYANIDLVQKAISDQIMESMMKGMGQPGGGGGH